MSITKITTPEDVRRLEPQRPEGYQKKMFKAVGLFIYLCWLGSTFLVILLGIINEGVSGTILILLLVIATTMIPILAFSESTVDWLPGYFQKKYGLRHYVLRRKAHEKLWWQAARYVHYLEMRKLLGMRDESEIDGYTLAEYVDGYKWVGTVTHKDDESLSWPARFGILENHHVRETEALVEKVRNLAKVVSEEREKNTYLQARLDDFLNFDNENEEKK